MSVTKNTVRNMKWGLVYQGLLLLFPFIIRTIIIRFLGEDYIGLSSLFTSILNLMNVAELGFSSAIIYNMYEPIANNNTSVIRALLAFYRKIYRTIGIIVCVLGLMVMPFLENFIKGGYPSDINLYVIYLLYLANTALGYFLFSYKTALLTAYHRNDVINKNNIIVNVFQYVVQIILLAVFRDYHIYLIMLPIATILMNLFNHFSSKKLFPECYCEGNISQKEKENVKKQVKGILVSKISTMLRNSLANIIISTFIGLTTLAIYNNYYFIMTAVHGILTIIGMSMKAGVGINFIKESEQTNYNTFKKMSFMYMWLACWFSCCMVGLFQPFMLLWTGAEHLVFSNHIMFLFPAYFFILCLQDIRNVYTDSAGLHWEIRYRAILESIVQVILSFVLAYFFGVFGILLATILTYLSINLTYGTKILFNYCFEKQSFSKFMLLQVKYLVIAIVIAAIVFFVCEVLPLSGIFNLLLRGVVCIILPNVLLVIAYLKDKEFIASKEFILRRILKK